MKQIINTDKAPKPVGPYSQAVLAGDMLFISGQLGIDPSTGKLGSDVMEQARQAMENIGMILKEAGFGFDKIVKTTVLLKSMDDFAAVNGVYAGFFTDNYPARAAYQVARLPLDALVEIEAVASR